MHFQKSPKELFSFIQANGLYFQFYRNEPKGFRNNHITKIAADSINQLLGANSLNENILEERFVWAAVFGMDLTHQNVISFIEDYYKCLKSGYRFASLCVEETVFSAILSQEKFKNISNQCDFHQRQKGLICSIPCPKMTFANLSDSILCWMPHRHP